MEVLAGVAKDWLSTLSCWGAAVHTHDNSWKIIDIKVMMMKVQHGDSDKPDYYYYYFYIYEALESWSCWQK